MRSSWIKSYFLTSNLWIFTVFTLLKLSSIESNDECFKVTPSGKFLGVLKESIINKDIKFCSFLGIRYGQPLLGEDRFGKPKLIELTDENVYNASSDGEKCPQISWPDGKLIGNEDCLYLNVFTPKQRSPLKTRRKYEKPPNDNHALKPVIVYIHGGAFFEGSSSSKEISPDYLIEHDVLLVTMNYRLHIFGFLNLGLPECGGNMGLRDQTLALKWVQRNIKTFGGDPNNVTLMGQSAGAISVHLLALSPLSRGLFHKAIILSPISVFFVKDTTESYSIDFVKDLQYKGDPEDRLSMLAYLKQFDTQTLLGSFGKFLLKLATNDTTFYAKSHPFWPSVDAHLKDEAFLPKSLEELSKETNDIPVIIGQTNMDGTIAYYQTPDVGIINDYVQKHLEIYLDPVFTNNEEVKKEVIAKIKEYYFSGTTDSNRLNKTIVLITDLGFYKFYDQNALFYASYHNNKIYNYQFCYDGSFQYYKKRYLGEKYYRQIRGVSHTEDLNYVFYSKNFFPNLTLTLTHIDRKVIREMCEYWTNFAKTGNPNTYNNRIGWEPISPQKKSHLRIDKISKIVHTRINEERRQFWDRLPRVQ